MKRLACVAALALLIGCAGSGLAGRGPGPSMRRDEQVLVGDLAHVYAIALTNRFAFVATRGGLAMMDRWSNEWLPPLSGLEGWPREPVTAIAGDVSTDVVWVAAGGLVVRYAPRFDALVRTPVPGTVYAIFLVPNDAAGNAWVSSSASCGAPRCMWRVSVSGHAEARTDIPGNLVRTPGRDEVLREFPSVEGFEPMLTRDAAMRSWQVRATTRAPEKSEVWLGTWGGGVFVVDPVFNHSRQRAIGAGSVPVRALARGLNGIWSVGGRDRINEAAPLTFTHDALRDFRWIAIDRASSIQSLGPMEALLLRGDTAWLGGPAGLWRVETRGQLARATNWTMLDGMPDDAVTALAARGDSVWIGTPRGLGVIAGRDAGARRGTPRGAAVRHISGDAWVHRLLFTGDTLWAATSRGLLMLAPGDDQLRRSGLAQAAPSLDREVHALVRVDSLVYAVTASELIAIDVRRERVLSTVALPLSGAGRPVALRADERSVWVATWTGIAIADRATGGWTTWPAPAAIGAIRDLELTPELAWLGTDAGLVRIRRTTFGVPR